MTRITKKNWDGIKYEWFDPIDFDSFVNRVNKDFDCREHNPSGDWKSFWNFYFTWKNTYANEDISSSLPTFCFPIKDISESQVMKSMINWRNMIVETYKKYVDAKIENRDCQEYVDTLEYWGWKFPKEPMELSDIYKNNYEYYFNKMGKTLKKNDTSPFCYKPMVLKKKGDDIQEFYFTVPSQINKAYVEVLKDGVWKQYDNDTVDGEKKKYFLAGGVSDTSIDRDGERMSDKCIKSMEESARKGTVELRNAHKKEWDSDLGKLVDIKVMEDGKSTLFCKFELNAFEEDATAKKLWSSVNKGKKIGYSIGGIVHSYFEEYSEEMKKTMNVYDDIELVEVSVTGSPSNTNTFMYALTKSMNELRKKPLRSGQRKKLPNSSFAYIGPNGERKLPINDANHTRNAMARFNQADIPTADKPKVWRKILAAARKFGIKVQSKKSTEKDCQVDGVEKYTGVNNFIMAYKDAMTDMALALQMMRNDLKNHMDNDDKESEEMNDTLDEIEDKLEDIDEDVDEEEGEVSITEHEEEGELSEHEFKILIQIMSILSRLDYPKDTEQPEGYWEKCDTLPIEAYVIVEGQKMFPHHNSDYTVNREWLMYQLRKVMDGEVWVDSDEYLEILNHLAYHAMETKLKKSTEPVEGEQVVDIDTKVESEETQTEEVTTSETEEVKTEEVKEEVKEPETKEEVVETESKETVEPEEKSEDVKVEDDTLKSIKQELDALKEKNAKLEAEISSIQNTPVYKQATEDKTAVTKGSISGEKLTEITGLRFTEKSYTKEEALEAAKQISPYDSYNLRQVIRNIYQ